MELSQTVFAAVAVGTAVLLAGGYALYRARRAAADAEALGRAEERERNLPRSLHPVIDPDICIGSLACLQSCPEGDILGMVHGAAPLVLDQDGHTTTALDVLLHAPAEDAVLRAT